MICEILSVANPVVGETALPDFSFSAEDRSQGMRVTAFDQLDSVLKRHVFGGSEQKVGVLGHEDEGMDLVAAFAAISVESLQEKADIVLDYEQTATLPSGEGNEISSRRGDESSRLQEQTSAAKAEIFA